MNKFTLIFALLAGLTTGTVNATFIDDFTEGSMHVLADDGDVYQGASSAFGGGRTVNITKVGARGAKADVKPVYGFYAHSTDVGTRATSTISWGNNLGVDLIENVHNNAFALDIIYLDQGAAHFKISVTDKKSHSDSYSLLGVRSEGVRNIAFNEFTGIDFQEITEISLQIVAGNGADLVINSLATVEAIVPNGNNISAVPVPPALILFTSSLMLLSISRRKV